MDEIKNDVVMWEEKDLLKAQGKLLALHGVLDYLQEEE